MRKITRLTLFGCLSAMAIALSACQQRLDLVLINARSDEIAVMVDRERQRIPAGASAVFAYSRIVDADGGILAITVANCVMRYKMPMGPEDYPWASEVRGSVAFQLDPDGKLYALPPSTAAILSHEVALRFQRGEFPLAPMGTCP